MPDIRTHLHYLPSFVQCIIRCLASFPSTQTEDSMYLKLSQTINTHLYAFLSSRKQHCPVQIAMHRRLYPCLRSRGRYTTSAPFRNQRPSIPKELLQCTLYLSERSVKAYSYENILHVTHNNNTTRRVRLTYKYRPRVMCTSRPPWNLLATPFLVVL